MAKSEWSYKSAVELSAALTAKKVSAVELTQDAIDRIERHDGKVNAICVRDFDRALSAARDADAARARGERKPLLGLPITVKESYNVAGLPTTWGIPAQKDFVAKEDALPVTRVKDAGTVIVGKTNVPLGLGDWQSYNDIYGTTNNPYDLGRTPGGSSGGSSAALAAGYGPLSIGSDIGGSLRVPAFHCGIYAHKPTFSLVAMRGHTPPPLPPLPFERDLSVIGPMARSAADLSLVLDVMAGPDPIDAGLAYRLELPAARHTAFRDFRVLVIDTDPVMPTDTARARHHQPAGRQPRQGWRQDRAQQPAAAGFRGLLAALYAHADVVPRLDLRAGRSMPARKRQQRRCQRATTASAAERLRGIALNHRDWQAANGGRTPACARNGASCSRRSTR